MRVSETILAEQLLSNAGISEDQRLMARTMLQGNMSFNRVAEELLAQHPRVHERERRQKFKGIGKGFGKPWRKPYNLGSGRSYWAEDAGEDDEGEWDDRSQSLTGYTAEYEGYQRMKRPMPLQPLSMTTLRTMTPLWRTASRFCQTVASTSTMMRPVLWQLRVFNLNTKLTLSALKLKEKDMVDLEHLVISR